MQLSLSVGRKSLPSVPAAPKETGASRTSAPLISYLSFHADRNGCPELREIENGREPSNMTRLLEWCLANKEEYFYIKTANKHPHLEPKVGLWTPEWKFLDDLELPLAIQDDRDPPQETVEGDSSREDAASMFWKNSHPAAAESSFRPDARNAEARHATLHQPRDGTSSIEASGRHPARSAPEKNCDALESYRRGAMLDQEGLVAVGTWCLENGEIDLLEQVVDDHQHVDSELRPVLDQLGMMCQILRPRTAENEALAASRFRKDERPQPRKDITVAGDRWSATLASSTLFGDSAE